MAVIVPVIRSIAAVVDVEGQLIGAGMELERRGAQGARRGNAEDVCPELSAGIIGAAMKVHSALGPGLLEAAYEECLCHELSRAGLEFRRQVPMPLAYGGLHLDCGFRPDIVVASRAIVEIKAVESLRSLHTSQLLTYLRISGLPLGLLINFNVQHLRDGIHRRVMTR